MSDKTHPELPEFVQTSFGIQIECERYIKVLEDERLQRPKGIALIAFKGEYRMGSIGRPEGMFIHQQIEMFDYLMPLSGLIVDFRKLNYLWGDNLKVEPRSLRSKAAPVRIIIPSEEEDPQRYKAFQWLDMAYRQLGVLNPNHELRTDIKAAYQEVVDAILKT